MKLAVAVSKKHIQQGFRLSIGSCPVALALKTAKPEAEEIRVLPYSAYFVLEGQKYETTLPLRVVNLIYQFDNEAEITPFEFETEFKPFSPPPESGFIWAEEPEAQEVQNA